MSTNTPNIDSIDIELVKELPLATQIKNSVDEMLSMTSGHQIVSASEISDKLLDIRLLVSQLEQLGEPHGDNQ